MQFYINSKHKTNMSHYFGLIADIRKHVKHTPRTCGCYHMNPFIVGIRCVPKKGGIVAEKPTPPRREKHCYADDDDARRALLDHPIVVGDDVSSSCGNKIDSKDGSLSNGTPISKRVHTNSQQIVVSFVGNLVRPLPCMAPVVTHDDTSFFVALHVPRYKDPPGYADVADFGQTVEPAFVPHLLEPSKFGVRCFLTQPLSAFIFVFAWYDGQTVLAVCLQFQMSKINGCACCCMCIIGHFVFIVPGFIGTHQILCIEKCFVAYMLQ